MPQIDKVTFISTVYWLVAFYLIAYIDLSTNSLYAYLGDRKVNGKKKLRIKIKMRSNKKYKNLVASTTGL